MAAEQRTTWRRVHALALWLVCAFNFIFLVGLLQILRTANHLEFVFGLPLRMEILLCLPLITTALAPAVAGFALSSWVDRTESLGRRFCETVVAAAAVGFVVLGSYWNLIGFNV